MSTPRLQALLIPLLALSACTPAGPGGRSDADLAPEDADRAEAEADAEAPRFDADQPLPLACGYPDAGYGTTPGAVIEPFWLQPCEGEVTTLPELLCDQRLTILHLSTLWCHLCDDSMSALLAEVLPALEGEPVALVELLLEGNAPGQAATLEECRGWSSRFGDAAPVYVPPEARLTGALFRLDQALPSPSILVVDAGGQVRARATLALPDHLEEQTAQLLVEIQALLAEP